MNAGETYLPDIEKALPPGMRLAPYAVRSRSDLEDAIERIGAEPNGALIVLSGSLTGAHRDVIVILAVKHRLPLVHPYRYFTAAGGLMSMGPTSSTSTGAPPATSIACLRARSRPTCRCSCQPNISLVINLKTAKALGIEGAAPICLARADEVIE